MSPTPMLFLLFAVCLLIHIPIGYSLAISSLVVVLVHDIFPPSFTIQTFFSSGNSFPLLAVPFFILAGDLMLQGGISSRLVELGRAIFGHMTGSLAIITVFCCAIFAALSGSGPATVAAIGGIMIPAMVDEKYEPGFAATIAATSGCLGPIIPPSIVFAVYGVSCSVSISDLFMAGFIPGLLLAFSLAVFSYIIAKRYNFGVKRQRQTVRQSLTATKNAIWALIAPMIILGGIYGGICTPTEAAVIACSYAFIVGLFIYREIRMGQLFEIFSRSALTAGTCLILLGGANAFGRILTLEQMPVHLYNFLTSVTESRIVVFLLVNLLLFTVGMFMETLAAVVILAPLLLTIVKEFGMSPLHFGVILTMNLTVGMCTPPVGVNLFIASGKAKCTLESMFKWLVPATAIMMVVVLFFTFCEPAITFFPQLLR